MGGELRLAAAYQLFPLRTLSALLNAYPVSDTLKHLLPGETKVNRSSTAISSAALICAALTSVTPSANAHPNALRSPVAATSMLTTSLVDTVQYRDRSFSGQGRSRYSGAYRGDGSSRRYGRNTAIGLGSLIIGGIVLSEIARSEHRRDNRPDWDRCAQTYRSFEPGSGLYTGYDGVRRPCPYLN